MGTDPNPTIDDPIVLPSSSSSVSFSSGALEQSVSFTANTQWSIAISESKSTPDWLTVSPMSGSSGTITLTLTTQENDTFEDRSASVVITASDQNYEISVSQKALTRELTIDPASLSVLSDVGELVINVSSNCDWATTEVAEWISLSESEGNGDAEITLFYSANESDSQRIGTFNFEADGISRTFTLTQAAKEFVAELTIDKLPQSVGAESGSFVVNVTSNTTWTTSGVPDWITLTPSSGTGNTAVSVAYSSNEEYNSRSATISFAVDGITRELEISQAAKEFVAELSIDKSSVSATDTASEFTLQVSSNTTWSTSDVPNWVVLTPSQGSGDTSVTVNIRENSTAEQRVAQITFSVEGIDLLLTITQSKNLSVDLDSDIDQWEGDDSDDDGGITTK